MLNTRQTEEIREVLYSLKEYALGDIRKSRKEDMLIASFILSFCFISTLSAYRYYRSRELKSDGKKFTSFIKEYFNSSYHPYADQLYRDLRSKLVHNYSANKMFFLSDERKDWHLIIKDSKIFLNVDVFVADVENAYGRYIRHLEESDEVKQCAVDHYRAWGILGLHDI